MATLTEAQFKSTIASPRLLSSDDRPPFDFWPYFDALPADERGGHDFSSGRVSEVYRMSGDRWEHVLVACEDRNVKLVLVLDLERGEVHGHYLLDLNQVYGLDDP